MDSNCTELTQLLRYSSTGPSIDWGLSSNTSLMKQANTLLFHFNHWIYKLKPANAGYAQQCRGNRTNPMNILSSNLFIYVTVVCEITECCFWFFYKIHCNMFIVVPWSESTNGNKSLRITSTTQFTIHTPYSG